MIGQVVLGAVTMRKILYIFGLLEDDDVVWLAINGKREDFSAGDTLVRQGAPLESVIIVLTGELAVTVEGVGEVARLGSGEIIGEMSFIDPAPPSATVAGAKAGGALLIDKRVLAEKLRVDVGFAARFYQALAIFLAHRLRSTVQRLGEGVGGSRVPVATPANEDSSADAALRFHRLLKMLDAAA